MNNHKILVMSCYGEFTPIAQRMEEEGTEVYTYIHQMEYRRRLDGILKNKIDVNGILPALRKCDTVIFDITHRNDKKPHDLKLLSKFGIKATEKDLFGSIAEKLRKSHMVIGASREASQLEWNREKGIELAKKIGLDIPEYQVFKTVKDGVRFLESSAGRQNKWVLKPWDDADTEWTYCETFKGELIDILQNNIARKFGDTFAFMLQEYIDGVEYATECWQDSSGNSVFYTRTLECKKLADGNMSKATGSQLNSYWITDNIDEKMLSAFKKLNRVMTDNYVGMTDANCIYTGDKRYFLEWTRRFGWSSTYLACSLVPKGELTKFFISGFKANFIPEVVSSEVVSLWPYPGGSHKELDENIKGNLINHDLKALKNLWLQDAYKDEMGTLRVAGSDGFVGVMAETGTSIQESIDKLYKKLDKLEISGNTQWRTKQDHIEQIEKRVKKLLGWGVELF